MTGTRLLSLPSALPRMGMEVGDRRPDKNAIQKQTSMTQSSGFTILTSDSARDITERVFAMSPR